MSSLGVQLNRSVLDFRDRKITIVLTLNVDGVRFKKLSRSESWPVYIRLEGLPFKEKNKYENIILAGIMFTRKPPTETLLAELFSGLKRYYIRLEGLPFKEKNKYENIILAGIMFTRKPPTETLLAELFSGLKHELEVLQREGIPIRTASDTWICTPKLVNGIIDFAALQTLYGLPRWQSLQGCHLCTFPGERSGRRVIWFNRFPDPHDRRTDESLIMDAEARQNGLRGWTQMMEFFTVNHCMPDALHLLSEGITCNVFKGGCTVLLTMFGPRKGRAVLAIRRDCFGALLVALQRTRNYTYSSKFILGAEDLSKCTGSEKEALSFVVFPLAAATRELTEADFPGVRDLGTSMKNLWYALDPTLITLKVHVSTVSMGFGAKNFALDPTLITLKVHCLVNHAVLEDLPLVGSPYHWSSSSFESMHRRLQLRIPQCTTNVGETIIENFLLHKDMVDKLEKEVKIFENDHRDRLHKKITGHGKRLRCNAMVGDFGLEGDWYVPADSVLALEAIGEEHREFLFEQRLSQRFSVVVDVCSHLTCGDGYDVWIGVQFCVGLSSRLSDGKHMYASSDYWKKSAETDTTQGVVYLETPDEEARFGQVIAFGFDSYTGECCVLLEEFVTTDPFAALYEKDSPPYVPNYDTGSCDDAENALEMARAITCGTTTTETESKQTTVVKVEGVPEKVHLELGLDHLRALVDHLSGRGPSSTTDDDNCWEEQLSASQLSASQLSTLEPSTSQSAESQQARPQRQRRGAPRQTGRV
ncbi:unnamed protein product, partial [Heligmosomoides polygyrus]|uniref:ALOG domain-containing protein n=1 Tax=Heligmosomoides polygyrus TaxID=6339 RepID=A0A183F958_HELPZ